VNEAALLDAFPLRLYALCALLLVAKMIAVGMATSSMRIRRNVFASPEDYRYQGREPASRPDPDIERARRAHRNDLENVLPFFAVGPIYALCEPSAVGAWVCFVGFTTARILHSIFYLRGLMPHRTIAFGIGLVLTLWMVLSSIWTLLR
jgi:uncharacterized MAPEG superfamily protein